MSIFDPLRGFIQTQNSAIANRTTPTAPVNRSGPAPMPNNPAQNPGPYMPSPIPMPNNPIQNPSPYMAQALGMSGVPQMGGMPQGGMPQGGMPQGGVPQGGMPQGGMPNIPPQLMAYLQALLGGQVQRMPYDGALNALRGVQ